MAQKAEGAPALQMNMDVDYVISYRFTDTKKFEAQAGLEQLVKTIARTGLEVEIRNGDNCSLLLFVKASDQKRFNNEVYKYRVKDWLNGVRAAQPDRKAHQALTAQKLTDAERYRIIYHLLTSPVEDGGAGLTPKTGKWKDVESIFPLHDHAYNKEWIKKWSTTSFLKVEDLDEIRDKFGEKVAFYFAFTQSYFSFLIFPASFGFAAYVLLGHFSSIYAVVSTLWCVTFVEYWKHQEVDLGVRWGVRGVSSVEQKRHDFKHEKEIKDPVTGETLKVFPASKRVMRQALQIPFAFLAASLLGGLIATCFGIEIFLSEVYDGPFKSYLVFLPTVLLTILIPTLSTILTSIATKLNDFENHETTEAYDAAMTSKIFILNFITSYLGIFLTAFVYVPFGTIIVPYLDVFSLTARPFADDPKQLQLPQVGRFEINPSRLRKQVIYFTVTAQIINFVVETIVPVVKRRGFARVQEIKSERAAQKGGSAPGASVDDVAEEAAFLKKIRSEAELDVYDVTSDLREMVIQFGYLALFSVVWPLTPVSFIINNWIELRSDAVKICTQMQRPVPHRAESIGPWLESLGFLTWLGSITSSALVYMFSNDGLGPDGSPATLKGWALLLTIFFSEHIYLVVRLGVRFAISKMYSPGIAKERAERFMVRKRYLEVQFGESALELPPQSSEKITRQSLEDDAREGSLQSSSTADRFWGRQKGWEESIKVGNGLIDRMAPDEDRKTQ